MTTIASYALSWDARSEHELRGLFVADATLEFDVPTGALTLRGGEEIAAFARERWAQLGELASRHIQGVPALELVTPDVARSRTPVMVTHTSVSGAPQIHRSGVYEDELNRHDGRWRFARRRLTADPCPGPLVPALDSHDLKEASH